jgi:HEAT repeat protein
MRLRRVVIGLALLLPAVVGAGEPAKDLRSRDVKVRLDAVQRISRERPPDGEKLLLDALRDRDWEVVERAAEALEGQGDRDSLGPLLKLAVAGPVRRVRLAAARSLLAIDAGVAGEAVLKRIAGPTAEAACEALGVLAPALDAEIVRTAFARGFASDEPLVRSAACRLVGAMRGRDRREALEAVLARPETSLRAAAIDSLRRSPRDDDLPQLTGLLHDKELNDVLERRVLAALVALVEETEEKERGRVARRAMFGVEVAESAEVVARLARLAGRLAGVPAEGKPLVSSEDAAPPLLFAAEHESPFARAAAAKAMGLVGTKDLLALVKRLAIEDASDRVRVVALRAVVHAEKKLSSDTSRLLRERLGKDASPMLREQAAVFLGVRDLEEAVPDLLPRLGDASWEVAVSAAVSLGKTRSAGAVDPLRALLKEKDWKLRGAGVVGLGHLRRKEVIPDLIGMLGDRDEAVARSAWEILKRLTTKTIAPSPKAWRKWWEENGATFEVPDLTKLAKEAKKYGYAPTYAGVYEDLDVVVLQSRGDHIEELLRTLAIGHRLTRSGQVPSAALHPYAIFVSNCTGQISPRDVEPLQWFVRTGGYLFSSCWGLHYTVEPVAPGFVRKYETPGQVLENVLAEPCPTASPYLEGVFDGVTRPIYVLYGAHLIEVLDAERVEVLIDSPSCADNWGEGNLACWFEVGHGVILDSANHFDLQGLEKAEGIKGAEGRMAYAMDHMGLTYEDLRALAAKRIWASRSKSAEEARDLSAFRFITNFVRHKRKQGR